MKFVLFNLIVGAALVYLFTADQGELNGITDKAQEIGKQVQQKVSDLVVHSETEKEPVKNDVKQAEPIPEKQQKAENRIENKVPVKVAQKIEKEQQPAPQAMKRAEETLPPEVIKRRNEILSGENEAVAETNESQTGERSDRRDLLLRLAEDMELYSLETMAK